MKFTDILELAKQGYTPKDIKELLELNVSDNSEEKPPEEVRTEEAATDAPNEQNDEATREREEVLDYKKLYEESQEKLKKAQKENINQNISNPNQKSNEDIINELARSFM